MPAQTSVTSQMKTSLEHLKHHVTYPVTRKGLIEACNNMSDSTEQDRKWFTQTIPEGTYRTPDEVMRALLAKV